MTDDPPVGVTLLSFEMTLIGATLTSAGGTVTLVDVSNPVRIEVKRLETETTFLTTRGVPPGTYTSLSLTFANAELTVKNDSASNIGGCSSGQVCELQRPLNPSQIRMNTAPFPLMLSTDAPAGVLVGFHLNRVVQGDLTLNLAAASAVTLASLPVGQEGELHEVEGLVGIVANKGAGTFTLQTAQGNLPIKVDGNTRFSDFNEATPPCTVSPQSFTCVANGQMVEVEARLLAVGGTLLARKVEFRENADQEEVEGTIVSLGPGFRPTQFDMVVVGELPLISGLRIGNRATVTISGGASFRVDRNGLTIPSDLTSFFQSASDLLVGQSVQVRRRAGSVGRAIITDRVRLRMSRFTARVAGAPRGSNFNVSNLPSLFTSQSPSINTIQVRTSTETRFEGGITGVSGLAAGNTVSLRGLVFKTTGNPVLVAKKVRKR